jgi:hypothetical protein
MKEKLNEIMKSFKEPFCSEADFQHSLAWKLHEEIPNANIILEYPWKNENNENKMVYYDIYVEVNDQVHLIELKYRTKKIEIEKYGQKITLKDHSALDMGCCHFWLDVQRLENTKLKCDCNYCIMLTNDDLYLKGPKKGSVYENFSLKNGITAGTEIKINDKDKKKVEKYWPKNATKIKLKNEYKCEWEPCMQNDEWKYLLLEIKR